ncbi:MAG: hypothetical protein KDK28_08605 [Maritimibacter sp.]|nr:hypothetical protein [Maritimibacter sp.]
MPKNATVSCPAGLPTQLTDQAVTAARVIGLQDFNLCATSDASPPADLEGAVMMLPFSVLAADLPLGQLFPGVGDTVYLWAWPTSGAVDVSVSHA